MRKKAIAIALTLVIALGIFCMPGMVFASSSVTANLTASAVYFNGLSKTFEAYNIGETTTSFKVVAF